MSKSLSFEGASLNYHRAKGEFDTNGKTATLLTKPCNAQEELSMRTLRVLPTRALR